MYTTILFIVLPFTIVLKTESLSNDIAFLYIKKRDQTNR